VTDCIKVYYSPMNAQVIVLKKIIIILNFDSIKMHSTNVKKKKKKTDCVFTCGESESMCASSLCLLCGTVESIQDLSAKQNRIVRYSV